MSNVALIGAGRVGGWVLEELIQRHHKKVKVLARSPEKLSGYDIEVIQGDATDESAVAELLKDTDVLISTIGSPNKETLVVEAAAKALVGALLQNEAKMPRIIWMTTIGVNEAITQAKMYPLVGDTPSDWFFGYGMFGFLDFKVLIPLVIGQDLWDDMGRSEIIMREHDDIRKQTLIVRPTNMHPVSEHVAFSEEWRKEGGENRSYVLISAEDPPPGKWINRRTIACALCDLIDDSTRDGTAVSLFQDGKP